MVGLVGQLVGRLVSLSASLSACLSVCQYLYCTRYSIADLCIEAQEHKVYPGTEEKIYNDAFFSRQDVVVNALDNVEARRYVDRCAGIWLGYLMVW